MQAMDVQCYLIVAAWCCAKGTARAIEPEFIVAHYAAVKKAAQTMLQTNDLMSMFQVLNCSVYYHRTALDYHL
jgi:hypothetical protein